MIHNALSRRGFTLVELLASIVILGVLFAIAASSMANLEAQSRVERTKTIIARLDQLISEKYESYKTRAIPLRIPARTSPQNAALIRLYAIRELMRMELPDRGSDLNDGPQDIPVVVDIDPATPGLQPGKLRLPQPSAWKAMRARMPSGWATDPSPSHAGAECLYMIVSTIRQGESRAIDFLTASEIGDTDGDGAPEILDGWGEPIQFLRWAPGYVKENGPLTMQTNDAKISPDPFDPLRVDPRYSDTDGSNDPYALKPLIFSPGRNRKHDIDVRGSLNYATAGPYAPSDPYYFDTRLVGTPFDTDGDGYNSSSDNITNHYFEVR